MNISLGDLMILEDRLTADRGHVRTSPRDQDADAISVSWAVSARTSVPHLPVLRGGEVLLLPGRVNAAVAGDLPALIREAERRSVSAFVLEAGDPTINRIYPWNTEIPVLRWSEEISPDTETAINRLLTECRSNLYQIGSDLERQMADAAAGRFTLGELLAAVSRVTGLWVEVLDAKGRLLAGAPGEGDQDEGLATPGPVPGFEHALPMSATLRVGLEVPAQRVMARFLVGRIAAAAAAALQRDERARPRGALRAEATEALLTGHIGSASDQRAAALALGLDPDGVFFVAVSDVAGESAMAVALAPLGSSQAAGNPNGRLATLVATDRNSAERYADQVMEVKRRWETEYQRTGSFLALSAPAIGAASIPAAAREAEFVAAMQTRARAPRPAASFASVADVGVMGLLYQVRDSSELRQFIAEALGRLEARDQRGTLRETLRAFFECGGSQVDASQRLGIHRNTLAYRLRRIGELVGCDVTDPASWLTLHLALRAAEMLEVCSEER